jgi:DNA-binding NtrC family response regulator
MSHILLADDQQTMKEFLLDELTTNGHRVTVIADPGKVMSCIIYTEPDLVLLNVLINNLEGWDLLSDIKTIKPSLPVVIFSVFDCFKDDPKASTADARIITDFRFDRIIKEIDQLLKGGGHGK